MPVAMLSEVGEQVVAVHGQSDQLRLLKPAEHRKCGLRIGLPHAPRVIGEKRAAPRRFPDGGLDRTEIVMLGVRCLRHCLAKYQVTLRDASIMAIKP